MTKMSKRAQAIKHQMLEKLHRARGSMATMYAKPFKGARVLRLRSVRAAREMPGGSHASKKGAMKND